MPLLVRYRIILILVCGILGFYALLGFVVVPYAVKAYGVPALSERLHHPILLGDVRFNPFTFSLMLSSFEIQEPDHTPMLAFEELFVNFEGTSLVRSAYLFDEIRLTLPLGFVHIQSDGKLNMLDLFPPSTETQVVTADERTARANSQRLPPVDIRLMSIRQGVIEFRDDTKQKPVSIDIVPIEITLRNFSTRPGDENAYAFSAEFGEGEVLAWKGNIHLDPLESSGRFSLANVKLNTFWPSLRDRFRFEILSGAVMLEAGYHVDTSAAPINLQLSDGKIVLSDFRLAAGGERDPIVSVPSLALEAIRLDLPKQELEIQTISLTGADVRTWMAPEGVIYPVPLFDPVAEDPAPTRQVSRPARPWTVDVHKVAVTNTHVSFEDRRLKTPAVLSIDDLTVTVDDLHSPSRRPLPITAKLRLNQQGSIESTGTVQLDPLQADLTMALSRIGLRHFQPYVDRSTHVDVKNGEFQMAGELRYRSRHESEPLLRYTGQIGVQNLSLIDRATQQEFLAWSTLELNKAALELAPTKVRIAEIALRQPSAKFMIAKDGSTNIARALRAPDQGAQQPSASPPVSAAAKKEASPAPTPPPIPITIDLVTLSKLSATFVDESIQPTVTTGIQDFGGTIQGLSSRQLSKAKVSLAGKVDKVAPITIQGQINPLTEDAFTNLTFLFQGLDLTAVSPYAGKYAGYPITKGKLSLDLKYQISKKQLVGENKVLVDQFTFGEKTESPDATGLPVRLAVALLKDRRGVIDIDMPVRGDLNEPDFRYGGVLLNALLNVITKVATSPFAALGGLVGGGGEDLQFVEFQAGAETLELAEQQKIESLAKALQERPALRVEVIGAADLTRDRDALALQKMSAEVQRRFTKGGTKNPQAAVSPEREFEFLSDLYAEKLGKQPTKREELPGGKSVERVLTVDELRQQLIPAMAVEESELRSLAQEPCENDS